MVGCLPSKHHIFLVFILFICEILLIFSKGANNSGGHCNVIQSDSVQPKLKCCFFVIVINKLRWDMLANVCCVHPKGDLVCVLVLWPWGQTDILSASWPAREASQAQPQTLPPRTFLEVYRVCIVEPWDCMLSPCTASLKRASWSELFSDVIFRRLNVWLNVGKVLFVSWAFSKCLKFVRHFKVNLICLQHMPSIQNSVNSVQQVVFDFVMSLSFKCECFILTNSYIFSLSNGEWYMIWVCFFFF